MNKSLIISKLQLLNDEIVLIQNRMYDDIINKIGDAWQGDESIMYMHKVEEVVSEFRSIIAYIEELKALLTK